MSNILFLTLVHPDFLPPVYASAQVMAKLGYEVDIFTFESNAPDQFNAGAHIHISTFGKHAGSFFQRMAVRKGFTEQVQQYVEKKYPKCIICFCEFSYLIALKYYKRIPIIYSALELTNFSLNQLFRSPMSAIRTWSATRQLHKADYLCTPSCERSGWLAGRYGLTNIPETIHNTPFISDGFTVKERGHSKLLPDLFKNKIKILNTGGVNSARCVKELILGFEKTSLNSCLIITNVGTNEYSKELIQLAAHSSRKEDILLLNTISRKDLMELQAACDIGVCLMKLNYGHDARMIAPNKVGEYLYSGMLVLGMDTPYFYQFIPYRIVELIEEPKLDSIGSGLQKLIDRTGNGGNAHAITNCLTEWYNMTRQMQSLSKRIGSYE